MKLNQLLEAKYHREPEFHAAFIVDDEGFADIETPNSPKWEYTVGAAEYAEWVSWREAVRMVQRALEGNQAALIKFFDEFNYRPKDVDAKEVKIFQDEYLVVLV